MNDKQFRKFKSVLEQSLMLDHAELDFGIYRIMNQKREQILRFLDDDLPRLVEKTLNEFVGTDIADLKRQLAEKETAVRQLGIDPSEAMEGHVYDHLAHFLARYYDNGDFMPIRRYRGGDTYCIPYDGEEVKLYWANADQYYIKTAEYFRHYAFHTPQGGKRVEFTLREATTEQNNNKEEKGKERRFRLAEADPVEVEGDTLHIYFTYEPMPKAIKQKTLVDEALERLKGCLPEDYLCLLLPCSEKSERSVLEKHLTDYVAKNSFDYFIHKDLRAFLRRELDFYVKNEMLVIDDIDTRDSRQFLGVLAEVKAVKVIGGRIIDFLAQIEDFQKRLWLKRKFVTQADYCLTLDRIPRALYPEICANDAQREEWVRLFAIDQIRGDLYHAGYSEPLTEAFLEAQPYLVLDTALFPTDFKHRLLAAIPHIDEQCNGLLINSENFQALRLLEEKYREKVKCIYIDPPYNAKSSRILYKNSFMHSSWLSLMENRLLAANNFLKQNGVEIIAIDEIEQVHLSELLKSLYPDKLIDTISIVHNPSGQQGDYFSSTHEYAIFIYSAIKGILGLELRPESEWDIRTFRDNSGNNNLRTDAANCFYPIYVSGGNIVGFGEVSDDQYHPASRNVLENNTKIAVFPIDNNGVEKKWVFERGTVESIKGELWVKNLDDGTIDIMRTKKRFRYKSCWTDSKYSANSYGSRLLTAMGIKFDFPKSIHNVNDCISIATPTNVGIILDFFAGSATTGHVIINKLRENGDYKLKYILIEMGSYFDTVTKPRVMKAVYSKDWNDGKPVSREGLSHCFKYLRLEQYEDTLNNLELPKKTDDEGLFKGQFRTDYTLSYMLDTEAEAGLLNMEWFDHPFDVKMRITRGTATQVQTVDMVETFNYLIGLEVDTMEWPQEGLCLVQGSMRQGGRTAVVWRDVDQVSDDRLKALLTGRKWDARRIYLNGDTPVVAALRGSLKAKVMNTEEEFKQRMFTTDDD